MSCLSSAVWQIPLRFHNREGVNVEEKKMGLPRRDGTNLCIFLSFFLCCPRKTMKSLICSFIYTNQAAEIMNSAWRLLALLRPKSRPMRFGGEPWTWTRSREGYRGSHRWSILGDSACTGLLSMQRKASGELETTLQRLIQYQNFVGSPKRELPGKEN